MIAVWSAETSNSNLILQDSPITDRSESNEQIEIPPLRVRIWASIRRCFDYLSSLNPYSTIRDLRANAADLRHQIEIKEEHIKFLLKRCEGYQMLKKHKEWLEGEVCDLRDEIQCKEKEIECLLCADRENSHNLLLLRTTFSELKREIEQFRRLHNT